VTVMVESTAAETQSFTERVRRMLTLKNLHIAGVAVLAAVCLYLLGQMVYAWQSAKSQDSSALAQQRVVMQKAEVAARPLAGLDDKLKQATVDADTFYQRRLPYSYSEVVGELGVLKNKAGVKLTRGQYSEAPVLEGGIAPLTEVRMDVSLSGDYKPLMLFINGLERDRIFFLIRSVALVGQQGGTVGVRLGLTTYLRAPVGAEVSDKAVPTAASESTTPAPSGGAPR
jgi:type IV pilus assembly protein PilO